MLPSNFCEQWRFPWSTRVERGDDTVGNPHRAQISQFNLFELKSIYIYIYIYVYKYIIRAFRVYPLMEIRQKVPCRAIRGNSISVSSALPALSTTDCPTDPANRISPASRRGQDKRFCFYRTAINVHICCHNDRLLTKKHKYIMVCCGRSANICIYIYIYIHTHGDIDIDI